MVGVKPKLKMSGQHQAVVGCLMSPPKAHRSVSGTQAHPHGDVGEAGGSLEDSNKNVHNSRNHSL